MKKYLFHVGFVVVTSSLVASCAACTMHYDGLCKQKYPDSHVSFDDPLKPVCIKTMGKP